MNQIFKNEETMVSKMPQAFLLAAASMLALLPLTAHGEDGAYKYMGAATCASSNCHGGTNPRNSTNVLQNEYVTWQRHDRHSMAQAILENEDSKKIAALLNIANAATEPLCLKCHATYVPDANHRGDKYRIEDGVSCESCHGAAERWLQSHTEKDASHARNLEHGMKDIKSIEKRTELCASCHMGTDDQYVDHRLIGAGHPRLSFELDTYQMLEPAHWIVDDDYRTRKGDYNNAAAWLNGQAHLASELLAKATSAKRSQFGVMPELTLFYCYTCHHSLDEQQWKKRDYSGRPGELRLNVAHLIILREALRVTNPELGEALGNKLGEIHESFGKVDISGSLKEAKQLIDNKIVTSIAGVSFDKKTLRALLRQMIQYGATQPHLPYEVAEQIAMAASAIIASEDPEGKLFKIQIDDLYKSLRNPNGFVAEDFTASAQAFAQALGA